MKLVVVITWREATKLIITVTNRDKLKDVDGDERSVFIVGFEYKFPTLDLLGEVNMPPEA